jgi:predicted DNA-binding transcriptional regulator YafY
LNARSRRAPLCRLLQIVTALRSDRCPNARHLAEECEVSRRTIFRDLEAIESAGLPVEYDAARQGYRLAETPSGRSSPLDEREVMALTLAVNVGGPVRAFGLDDAARSGLSKLIGGLSGGSHQRAIALDAATRAEGPKPPVDAGRKAIYDAVFDALTRGVQVRVMLLDPGREAETTLLAPYRLLATRKGWSVVGRSSVDRCVRLIPLAQVESAEATEEPASVPPRFRPDRWLGRNEPTEALQHTAVGVL